MFNLFIVYLLFDHKRLSIEIIFTRSMFL